VEIFNTVVKIVYLELKIARNITPSFAQLVQHIRRRFMNTSVGSTNEIPNNGALKRSAFL